MNVRTALEVQRTQETTDDIMNKLLEDLKFRKEVFIYMIINLRLNLGDGSLYGNANINNESSFEINIQEGIDSTVIIPKVLNMNPGQAEISFNTENGKRIIVKSNVKKEDTDMIQIFTNLDTLVALTKDIPLNMEIK